MARGAKEVLGRVQDEGGGAMNDPKILKEVLDIIQDTEALTLRFILATLIVTETITLDAFRSALKLSQKPLALPGDRYRE
jgi:hypothetical protein